MSNVSPMQRDGGGFAAFVVYDGRSAGVESLLRSQGAVVQRMVPDDVVLAVWEAFPGQGLWCGPEGAVAYDADLTNEASLREHGSGRATGGDTGELIWQLYKTSGIGFIDRLRGAFSFALWDTSEKAMLVVTDAFGIRPVVYSDGPAAFSAASRIRFLRAGGAEGLDIDPEAIYHYLFYQAICSPVTVFRGIRKLDPGRGLILRGGRVKNFTHYDIRYRPFDGKDESYWRKAIFSQVRDAVGRFVSLSPYEKTGCYLSGGTDSSSVAGFFTQLCGRPAKTFSIGFNEPEYNELDYAHIAARHFGTHQHDYYVTPKDVLDLIRTLPVLYDEPFGNSSVVPAYFCAKLAKDNYVDFLLGGDGGDEIFGGNERYVDNLVFALYHRFPQKIRQFVFEPALARMPDKHLIHMAKRYVRRANFPNPDRFFSYNLLAELAPGIVFREEFLEHLDTDCFIRLARVHYRRAAPAHDTDRLLYIDMKFTITDNDLRKVNRMAEAAGVRVRYPLLDRDLVDFTTTIPPTLKVKWKRNRYIFKRAMEGFLPQAIITKTKHGMGLPIAVWFKKHRDLYELLNDTLFSGTPRITRFIRPEFLDLMRNEFWADETPYYGSNLWVFLILELWLRHGENSIVSC